MVRSRDFVAGGGPAAEAGADVGGGTRDGRGVAPVPLDVEQGNDLAAL
jgi:hypothetical protein